MEDLLNKIEQRIANKQFLITKNKWTYRLKYWFYDILVDHTNLIMISILGLFTLLAFGSLAIGLMISDIFIAAAFIYAIVIPLGYGLICSSMSKLIDLARQLQDEIS